MLEGINEIKENRKNENILPSEQIENNKNLSKKKIIMLFSVAIASIIIIIIYLIIITSNSKKKETNIIIDETNRIILKYKPDSGVQTELFGLKYINFISSIEINGQNIYNLNNTFIFNSTDFSIVELKIKNNIDSLDQMFKNNLKLIEIDLSKMKQKILKICLKCFMNAIIWKK